MPTLEMPSEEQNAKREARELYTGLEKNIEDLSQELGSVYDMADELGVELDNDYDRRVKDIAYRETRNYLLKRRANLLMSLDRAEAIRDDLEEDFGIERRIDA